MSIETILNVGLTERTKLAFARNSRGGESIRTSNLISLSLHFVARRGVSLAIAILGHTDGEDR